MAVQEEFKFILLTSCRGFFCDYADFRISVQKGKKLKLELA